MADYYAILSKALTSGDAENAQWRREIYGRTREMLLRQLRAHRPALANSEIKLHMDALEAAIQSIEADHPPIGADGAGAAPIQAVRQPPQEEPESELPPAPDRGPIAARRGLSPVLLLVLAIVIAIAAVAGGGYAFWTWKSQRRQAVAAKMDTPAAGTPTPRVSRAPSVALRADGDLAPGVDGGSKDTDVSYVFRRQPVFYRTTHPAGTVIIDKQQHFLYLIRPNSVALRYGIGLGAQCANVAGLRRVSAKQEWPPWQPPVAMVERKLAPAGNFPGGPGNPLGARLLDLDDGHSRIHGTNAPKTIGSSVEIGCFRLVNDEVSDLYNRVAVGGRVVVGD